MLYKHKSNLVLIAQYVIPMQLCFSQKGTAVVKKCQPLFSWLQSLEPLLLLGELLLAASFPWKNKSSWSEGCSFKEGRGRKEVKLTRILPSALPFPPWNWCRIEEKNNLSTFLLSHQKQCVWTPSWDHRLFKTWCLQFLLLHPCSPLQIKRGEKANVTNILSGTLGERRLQLLRDCLEFQFWELHSMDAVFSNRQWWRNTFDHGERQDFISRSKARAPNWVR